MRIGLLSDTHGYLDPRIPEHFKECDEIWHAGDFGEGVLETLQAFRPLKGVTGNIDGIRVRSQLQEHFIFEAEGMKVLMVHIAGPAGSYNPAVRQLIAEANPQLLVCGHSHILKVMHDKKYGLLYMNPGAAGKHGFHKIRTLLRFEISNGKILRPEVIELGLRNAIT